MRSGVGLGRHLIVEMYSCNPKVLDSIKIVRETLIKGAKESNSIVLGDYFHKFTPQGVTGVVVVAESHLAIHTWPEYKYAAVDIFTCGNHTDPWKALEVIRKVFKPEKINVIELKRGLLDTEEYFKEPKTIAKAAISR